MHSALSPYVAVPSCVDTSLPIVYPIKPHDMVEDAAAKAENKGSSKLLSSPSSNNKSSRILQTNFRTEEIRGYLFKKTRDGKWQKRWFETNGCFLTYYKKQGQKLLAALNLPQVGDISLLPEDHADGAGQFTIGLNERVYTIKARSHQEAAYWVDALLWRKAGGVVTLKSPAASSDTVRISTPDGSESLNDTVADTSKLPSSQPEPSDEGDAKGGGGGCGACCIIQ